MEQAASMTRIADASACPDGEVLAFCPSLDLNYFIPGIPFTPGFPGDPRPTGMTTEMGT